MYFPQTRMRRLRRNGLIREMVRETRLSPSDLIFPMFVCPGEQVREEIPSMPGNYHFSVDLMASEVKRVRDLGIPGVILFGLPEGKDEVGSEGYDDQGIVQKAIRAIKSEVSDILVITDVCMCEYTDHGHCGIIRDGDVDNDSTLELLARASLSHVRAGADIVAPSDMMDGRVGAIRRMLDENGFQDTPIMAYSAKYSSAFYGPFREAADSTPQFGDRRSYQMDPANSNEAMREIELDIAEGADIVMVKPALPYLDIIYRAKTEFGLPVAAYNVSGEYAIIEAGAANGWIDGDKVMMEALLGIKRAGADLILTYFAPRAAALLQGL